MRYTLDDLIPGQAYVLQARYLMTDGTYSAWSQAFRYTTNSDTIAPNNVTGLSFVDTGASFVATWNKVTTDALGGPLNDFSHYLIEMDYAGTIKEFRTQAERFELTRNMNITAFGQFRSSLTIRVWAVDQTNNRSAVVATASVAPVAPTTPSTPTATLFFGDVLISWDGKTSTGAAMPTNVEYAEVHGSTTNGFTPSPATMVGRVLTDGSGSKFAVSGLTAGTVYYFKIVAVNVLGMKSPASAQVSATPTRLSGLDIENGTIGTAQINFTAKGLGGANAYYGTTFPTGGTYKDGDIFFNTATPPTVNAGKTYRHNGTTWVEDANIGVISGTKILASTLTANAVGTNQIIASRANIANAIIDEAHITSVNAASIRTGALAASQAIIAGIANQNHAEMTSTGFYVKGPSAESGGAIVDKVRLGSGANDFFAIPDPLNPDSNLAAIDETGRGNFQDLTVANEFTIGGETLTQKLSDAHKTVGEASILDIRGLNVAGGQGIRDEYGIGQFSFTVEPGRTYEIHAWLNGWQQTADGGQSRARVRLQVDNRTQAQKDADAAPTPVSSTTPSQLLIDHSHPQAYSGQRINPVIRCFWSSGTYSGVVSVGLSLTYFAPPTSADVIKIFDGSNLYFKAIDCGPTRTDSGIFHNQGGTLYSWTSAQPTSGSTGKTQYYKKYKYDWVRSYNGDLTYNTGAGNNTSGGRCYQGAAGTAAGNMVGYFGWNTSFVSLLTNATVDKIMLYLYFTDWYYSSGGTARIGYHSVFGDPGTANRASGIAADLIQSTKWPEPGARKIDITAWAAAMKSGSFRGIALGPGVTTYTDRGYATDAIIEIWYTK